MDEVVRWEPVSDRFVGHRVEPLIRERLWGNDEPLPPEVVDRSRYWGEAGYDRAGRPVAFRTHGEEGEERVDHRADGTVVLHLSEGGTVTTTFDDAGRPIRADLEGVDGARPEVERYEYDEAGRVIAIDEAELQVGTRLGTERPWPFGGRLDVEHDEAGPTRIKRADGVLVWERPTEPWEQVLGAAADRIAAAFRDALGPAVDGSGLDAPLDVYGLAIVYSDQTPYIDAHLAIGLEAEREASSAIDTLYLGGPIDLVRLEGLPQEELVALLRAAAMEQPDDPRRAVLGAVARRLSDGELPGIRKTNDFVAWVAAYDEGLADKVISIQLSNAPAAVDRWERGWGAGVRPHIDDGPLPTIYVPDGIDPITPEMVRRGLDDD